MTKRGLYTLAGGASLAGCIWVLLHLMVPAKMYDLPTCFFRSMTGLPCPSCGSTHSVLNVLHLNWPAAAYDNPFGFILAAGIVVIPVWLVYDLVTKKSSFFAFYCASETVIRRRWVGISLVVIVAANWIWNIYKCTS